MTQSTLSPSTAGRMEISKSLPVLNIPPVKGKTNQQWVAAVCALNKKLEKTEQLFSAIKNRNEKIDNDPTTLTSIETSVKSIESKQST